MHRYHYIGKEEIDGYCLYLRRQGYTAYLEVEGGSTHLLTDHDIFSSSFIYLGKV